MGTTANQRERPIRKRDKKKRLLPQLKPLSMSAYPLESTPLLSPSLFEGGFYVWHSCWCEHLCWKTHSIGRLGSTTESRGEDDNQSIGWRKDLEVCSVLFPIHFLWGLGQGTKPSYTFSSFLKEQGVI